MSKQAGKNIRKQESPGTLLWQTTTRELKLNVVSWTVYEC
jgi:hypothetical protein